MNKGIHVDFANENRRKGMWKYVKLKILVWFFYILAYIPVRDGAAGLQQPSTLRKTWMFAHKVWKG